MWYNPYPNFTPVFTPNYGMQQPMQQTQQMNVPQQQQNPMLRGRAVTSVEEVKASPIVMDGVETYFPLPAENAIYTKYVDLNGNPVIRKYVQAQEAPSQEQIMETSISDLENRVKSLESIMSELNAPAPRKGGAKQ